MRRILIASANPWSFALAVERQMAREHSGDAVDFLNLWSICGRFSPHWSKRDRMIERLNRKIPRFVRPLVTGREITGQVAPDHRKVPPVPADVTDLRHYRLDGVPVGLAVLSSVYELTTVHNARSPGDYGGAFEDAWRSAHLSLQIGQSVARLGYDRIYIFGGRHCYSRPFVDVAAHASEVMRYEQGGTGTAYVMTHTSFYEPDTQARAIGSYPLDERAGREFFEERLNRSRMSDAGFFTGKQTPGRIPQPLRGRPLVTFFNSSVDELYAIRDEIRFGSFATQCEAALTLARTCREEGKGFAIRFHPHLQYKHASWRDDWDFAALQALGAALIMPDDPTDTYALVRASESVLSCGSTISFEASYLGVPNAVIGEGLSSAMGVSEAVQDAEQLRRFVRSPSLPEDAARNALKLGSFYKNGGTRVVGLDVGSHPNFSRIDGRIVDPVRHAIQLAREWGAKLRGRAPENRSGIVKGLALLPSGARYRTR
jgi:hypothetical protein